MATLATGGSGRIGSPVVSALSKRGATVSAPRQKCSHGELPKGVEQLDADALDVDFMRELLAKFGTLFILNPVVADALTRGQLMLDLAYKAVIRRIGYFSTINADTFADVPPCIGEIRHRTGAWTSPPDRDHPARQLLPPERCHAEAAAYDDGLRMPVLAVGGEANAGPMLETLCAPVATSLTVKVIAGAGHGLSDERPVETADALSSFFAGV